MVVMGAKIEADEKFKSSSEALEKLNSKFLSCNRSVDLLRSKLETREDFIQNLEHVVQQLSQKTSIIREKKSDVLIITHV